MEFETHKKFAELVLKTEYDISPYYLKNAKIQANEPDKIKDKINGELKELFKKYPPLKTLANNQNVISLPNWHTLENSASVVIFLGNAATYLAKKKDTKNSIRLFSWALHYLIDSGTPYHKDTVQSGVDYIFEEHQRFEQFIDKNIKLFAPIMQTGINTGLKNKKLFTKNSVTALVDYAKSKYPIVKKAFINYESLQNSKQEKDKLNSEKELIKQVKEILKEIGHNIGRFSSKFQLTID